MLLASLELDHYKTIERIKTEAEEHIVSYTYISNDGGCSMPSGMGLDQGILIYIPEVDMI